ncbi:MAG TPA: PEGA domain-containing protein [Polyangia bacterium]|nr:PEGA domain-containing protein [Polyangia bacterium]
MTVRTATPKGAWKVALSIVVVCAAPATRAVAAPAQPSQAAGDKARAQVLLSEGTAAYGRGDYAAALDKFTAAYRIFPSPKLWFNIGQANRDLGRPVDAVAAFDRFLREAGDAPPETLSEARRSAAELKTKLGQIQVACPTDGADVTVDGKPVGSTPLGEMVWTTPGRHQVAVQHAGFSPTIEDVAVAAGKTVAIQVDLRPIDLRPANARADAALVGGGAPGAPRKRPLYRRPWFWVAAGAVVAAGAATAVVISRNASSGLETTLGTKQAF